MAVTTLVRTDTSRREDGGWRRLADAVWRPPLSTWGHCRTVGVLHRCV